MQTKMLDAGVLSGTASLIARKAGFRELGDLADLGLHYPMAPIGTTKSYLQKNEEVVKEFMLAYIEAIHDFKRNKEAALAVLKKYTRNDDREVLEDSYSNAASKYLALPIPTIEGIRTILTELSSTVPRRRTPIRNNSSRTRSRGRSRRAGLSNGSTKNNRLLKKAHLLRLARFVFV